MFSGRTSAVIRVNKPWLCPAWPQGNSGWLGWDCRLQWITIWVKGSKQTTFHLRSLYLLKISAAIPAHTYHMMTSWHDVMMSSCVKYGLVLLQTSFYKLTCIVNAFCITGTMCVCYGKCYYWWIPLTKVEWRKLLVISLLSSWTSCWTNSWIDSDLRHFNTVTST